MAASIVIPLLKQNDAWLEQCVGSALGQTMECDVVVVTSPGTPESNRGVLAGMQRRCGRLRCVECPAPKGFAGALNLGISVASAERIGFLLSDDWLAPDAVARTLPLTADIVSTAARFYAEDGITELRQLGGARSRAAYAALKDNCARAEFLSHFFLFRRSALEQAGGVDESLGDSPGVDDFDLIWSMLDGGASVAIVEEALYNMRDHEGERLTRRNLDEMLRTFDRILEKHEVKGARRRALVRRHSLWFGRSLSSVQREIGAKEISPALRPLQQLYRNAIPLHTRVAIHRTFFKPPTRGH